MAGHAPFFSLCFPCCAALAWRSASFNRPQRQRLDNHIQAAESPGNLAREGTPTMTSISGTSATMSPSDRVQLALQAAVSAGTVSASDQTVLSGAISDINTSLQSATPAVGTDPSSMKDKVLSLVDDEVSNGKLTDSQATELKSVFAQAMSKAGGHHHHMHMHAASPSSDGSTSNTSNNPLDAILSDLTSAIDSVTGTAATSVTGTTSASSTTPASSSSANGGSASPVDSLSASISQLVGFLKQVEQSVVGNYTSAGATSPGATATSAILVNSNA
jgi:hypothetical protein